MSAIVTVFLLAPVSAILLWLYARALPDGWRPIDGAILVVIAFAVALVLRWSMISEWQHAGPIWDALLASVSAYAVLLTGLGLALWWRRRRRRG